eukprot:10806159-Alexandrium_andersonii.AAC.1
MSTSPRPAVRSRTARRSARSTLPRWTASMSWRCSSPRHALTRRPARPDSPPSSLSVRTGPEAHRRRG